jgi:hypothetical protein
MFERSQVKHNNLDCHFLGEYFSLIRKFTFQSLTQIKNVFHVQNIQTFKMDSPYFFQTSVFLPNVHHSF